MTDGGLDKNTVEVETLKKTKVFTQRRATVLNEKVISKNLVSSIEDLLPVKNDTPYKRILVIGDCHGCYDKLMSLWGKISVREDDLVIFLGDYIDRGDKVAETLMWIMEQSKKKNRIFLRGNHEQMMLNYFRGRTDKILWFWNGGQKTYSSLLKMQAEDKTFVDKVLDFVENLPLIHSINISERNYHFVHAGVRLVTPHNQKDEKMNLWTRKEFFHQTRGYNGKDVIIVGHTPTQRLSRRDADSAIMMTVEDKFLVGYMSPEESFDNTKPFRIPNRNILMMDTCPFIHGGKISCVDILTGTLWQA